MEMIVSILNNSADIILLQSQGKCLDTMGKTRESAACTRFDDFIDHPDLSALHCGFFGRQGSGAVSEHADEGARANIDWAPLHEFGCRDSVWEGE
jgi:hypothetical protein